MGVTGLWQILHPCARPIKLETLNRKRLAVDASIWIYQFLKAVRDKDGNALRNSHVVGFFRRICKLLFFGIKPVFVFDGGAPVLKRRTVGERKKRREGRREDAVRTAGRLLGVEMQRRAEEEEQLRRKGKEKQQEEEGEEEEEGGGVAGDENLVYVEEIGMDAKERQQTRKFKKKDQYHLPALDVSLTEMGGPNDPRIMSLEELQAYAKQFETGEDINVYDFSKIDYDSPFFTSLPPSDRYNILNAARLRSRLRMGHSKEQLDSMFPDRMAFSKFQVERVRERNELTQRLMHINEGGDTLFHHGGGGGRVAGEKGREYVLVKNDGVEGGWALGVISEEGTKRETAIDVDMPASVVKKQEGLEDEGDEEENFEDVPIEGLNRLPKRPKLDMDDPDGSMRQAQRQVFYDSRKVGGGGGDDDDGEKRRRKRKGNVDSTSLFVTNEEVVEDGEGEEWEDVDEHPELFGETEDDDEEKDLQRAIAMSLENEDHTQIDEDNPLLAPYTQTKTNDNDEDDDMLEVFSAQSAVPESRPLPKGSGRAIASIVNKRAFDSAAESREVTSFGVPGPKPDGEEKEDDDEEEEDTMDLQAALVESRKNKRKTSPPLKFQPRQPVPSSKPQEADPAAEMAKQAGFSGPLPFEKLDLGSSLLGKKKMQERSAGAAGGFVNAEVAQQKAEKVEPLPPWFAAGGGDVEEGIKRQREVERREREEEREFRRKVQFRFEREEGESGLARRRGRGGEVIDLEAEDDENRIGEVIDLEAGSFEENEQRSDELIDREAEEEEKGGEVNGVVPVDTELRMGDLADKVRVEPPATTREDNPVRPASVEFVAGSWEADQEGAAENGNEEILEWSESENENENDKGTEKPSSQPSQPAGSREGNQPSRSPSAEFEDVGIPEEPMQLNLSAEQDAPDEDATIDAPTPTSDLVPQDFVQDEADIVEFDDFSDPEDEELLRQLTLEAEEHARFASTWNNKSQAQNVADYEKELKQLRNQQKKDRRDADEVTHIMIAECQQLLRLFGLPYITAPMEAEAQCAELVNLGLVDGIVTDDSDCFLFGGTRIYKNMFNQAKFVECYLTSDLEKEFDLTRDKLIQVAHLLGSDYTEGVPGVGPVTALEILGEFPTLQEFKDWWSGVQMNTIAKSHDAGNPFRKKFRRHATKLFLPPTFPDTRVDVAYNQPDVDSNPESFQWGVPDLDALRSFLMATIGWSQERTDEVLVPVIKDMNRRADEGTQSNITAFFDGGVGVGAAASARTSGRGDAFAPRKRVAESSKRMGNALSSMAEKAKRKRARDVGQEDNDGTRDERASDEPEVSVKGARKQKSRKASMKDQRKSGELLSDDESGTSKPVKRRKKRANPNNLAQKG